MPRSIWRWQVLMAKDARIHSPNMSFPKMFKSPAKPWFIGHV
jgi:hypothetical protein